MDGEVGGPGGAGGGNSETRFRERSTGGRGKVAVAPRSVAEGSGAPSILSPARTEPMA